MDLKKKQYSALDPYVKFSQAYSKKYFGLDLVEVTLRATNAWNKLSNAERRQFQVANYEYADTFADGNDNPNTTESSSDSSGETNRRARGKECVTAKTRMPLKQKRRSAPATNCPSKTKSSMPSCSPKTKSARMQNCSLKAKARTRRTTKSTPKMECAPKKLRSAPNRKTCPKPRCAPKRRRARCATKSKPGHVSSNGYLNFLREYKKKNCGLKAKDLIMRAARAWCRLSEAKKEEYRHQTVRKQKQKRSCK